MLKKSTFQVQEPTCVCCARVQHNIIKDLSQPRKEIIIKDEGDDNDQLLSAFFECFECDGSGVRGDKSAAKFCITCSKFLKEWRTVQKQISELLSRAKQIRISLTAMILTSSWTNDLVNFSRRSSAGKSCNLTPSMSNKISAIKTSIWKEFSAKVAVKKIGSPSKSLETIAKTELDLPLLSASPEAEHWEYEPTIDILSLHSSRDGGHSDPEVVSIISESDNDDDDDDENFEVRKARRRHSLGRRRSSTAPKKTTPRIRNKRFPMPAGATIAGNFEGFNFRILNGKFYCDECGKERNSQKSVQLHIRKAHLRKPPLPAAEQKPYRYTNVQELGDGKFARGPFIVQRVGDEFKCLTCGSTHKILARVLRHVNVVHFKEHPELKPEAPKRKVCKRAKEVGKNQYEYEGHPFSYDPEQRKFICGYCGTTRGRRNLIQLHLRDGHIKSNSFSGDSVTVKRKPAAEQKPSRYTNVDDLGDGRYARGPFIVQRIDDHFKCLTCGVTGGVLASLLHHVSATHFKEHSEPIPKRRERRFCKRATEVGPGMFEYEGHPFTFDAVQKKYRCGYCGVGRVRKNLLTLHMRSTHITPDSYPRKPPDAKPRMAPPARPKETYICEECGKTYHRISALNVHIRANHRQAAHQCTVCGKTFKAAYTLHTHSLIHQGEEGKKYICGFCGMKFFRSYDLKKHEKHHTGEHFECITCKQTFPTFWKMKSHRMKTHKNLRPGNPGKNRSATTTTTDDDDDIKMPVSVPPNNEDWGVPLMLDYNVMDH